MTSVLAFPIILDTGNSEGGWYCQTQRAVESLVLAELIALAFLQSSTVIQLYLRVGAGRYAWGIYLIGKWGEMK